MKTFALAVLLAVMQASPPIPRQTSDADAGKGQPVQTHADTDKKPAAQSAPVVQTVGTPPNQSANPTKGNENAEHPVRIRELPPVSVMRDWMDCLALVFSAILLIVGICGVRAAYKTLKAIEQQVAEMKAQREAMQGQLTTMQGQLGQMESSSVQTTALIAATQKSANAAKTSADIVARVAVPTLAVEKFGFGYTGSASMAAILQFPNVEIVIKNYGQTPAFLRSWTIIFACGELPQVPIYADFPGSGIVLEKEVVKPGESYTLPTLPSYKRQKFSADDIEAILTDHKLFYAYGYICYWDLFGNPVRRYKFCEEVLNIGDSWAQWTGVFSKPPYVGIDEFRIGPEGQRFWAATEIISESADTQAENHPEEAN
jgi:hypothetical protein